MCRYPVNCICICVCIYVYIYIYISCKALGGTHRAPPYMKCTYVHMQHAQTICTHVCIDTDPTSRPIF